MRETLLMLPDCERAAQEVARHARLFDSENCTLNSAQFMLMVAERLTKLADERAEPASKAEGRDEGKHLPEAR